MLTNWLDFTLLTLFNATICILLPRLLTLDWSKAIADLVSKTQKRRENDSPGGSVAVATPSQSESV
ncbi:hypothetical protein [Oxynema aestuarii]|uniref:Uncharacterized protein n=1 Tax=Oxynema aestuarii AP17 TaxID=2064643 RepID=A0A6H1TTT0_9CYAN|nr:hypothetical protein [Oxynema aestuarii]QIZ69163.1 hypothetical protein HCG48_15800 [Oxynema aestuarii AP17]RMH77601.1 MAG: hypothetical protein D6680_04670 [Cyanobacteria bacterium J007]